LPASANAYVKKGATKKILYCPSNPELNKGDQCWTYSGLVNSFVITGYMFLLNNAHNVPTTNTVATLKGIANRPASTTELVVDPTIADASSSAAPYLHVVGWFDQRTSHLEGKAPAGANELFLDGHVEWVPYKKFKAFHTFTFDGLTWEY